MYFNQNESAILELIDAFTLGKIAAPDFEQRYSAAWRTYRDSSDTKNTDTVTQRFFDGVFTLVDSYCSTPGLIEEHDLNANELLNEVSDLKSTWEKSIFV
ncbi:colicin immunity domain-containing protein [Phytobacter ursingii]